MGGDSTKISLFHDGLPLSLFSVKVGAVRLTEQYLISDPPKAKQLSNLKAEVRAAFDRPARELRSAKWHQASGTSGTVLAIGAALRGTNSSSSERKNQAAQPSETEVPLSQLSQLNTKLASMTLAERRAWPGISSQRSEIIVAGGHILEGAMRGLGLNVLRPCDCALREGGIIDRLGGWEDESRPPVPDFADQKLRGVDLGGRRFI